MDLETGEIHRSGASDRLPPQLVSLLAWLAGRPGEVISRETLHREVWGFHPDVVSRAADVAMRRLRTKVERDPAEPRHLLSVRGEGYLFVPLSTGVQAPVAPGVERWPAGDERAWVGHGEVLTLLEQALERGGVVSLAGPPGVGKSTLLRRAGASWLRGPRRWVSLDALDGPDELLQSIAGVLDVALGPGDAGPAVARALAASGDLLLALDGADSLLEALLPHLGTWREAAPGLVVCVTSRERLRLRHAQQVVVPPLEGPEARELFRALGGAGEGEEALLEQLDGLPLAIELAAGRCELLSPTRLLERMQQRLAVLATREQDVPARHRTLRAALELSWELLDHQEQEVLVAMSCFAGAAPLESIEELIAEAVPAEQVLDLVQRLVDKSLVRPAAGGGRLALLRSVRAYVLQRERREAAALWPRHARIVLREPELLLQGRVLGPGDGLMSDVLPHVPELRLVERRAAGSDLGARATVALAPWRAAVLEPAAHLELLQASLQDAATEPGTRASLHAAVGYLLVYSGRPSEADGSLAELRGAASPWRDCGRLLEAVRWLWLGQVEQGAGALPAVIEDLARDGRTRWEMEARIVTARVARNGGELEDCRQQLHTLRMRAERVGDRNYQGRTWLEFARCSVWVAEHDRARTEVDRAVEMLSVEPPSRFLLDALLYVAVVASRQGHDDEALATYGEVVRLAERTDQRRYIALALSGRVGVLDRLGRGEEIRASLERAVALARELSLRAVLVTAGLNLAIFTHQGGDLARARELYTEAVEGADALGIPSGAAAARAYLAVCLSDLGTPHEAREVIERASVEALASGESATNALVELAKVRQELPSDLEVQVEALGRTEPGLAVMCGLVRRLGNTP